MACFFNTLAMVGVMDPRLTLTPFGANMAHMSHIMKYVD